MRTPTSATSGKFNVKANEFVPNPAANTFLPGSHPSNASSPRAQSKARVASQASSPNDFFGKKKPLSAEDRPSILDNFNPLKRLKEKAEKDGKTKDLAANGGIPFAYATPVTWTSVKDGEEGKSYKDMFDGVSLSTGPSPRPMNGSPMNPNMAHQHQLPPHLQHAPQGTPTMPLAPQGMYPGPPPQHIYPGLPQHFEDHRASPSTYPVQRLPSSYGGYPVPVGQAMAGPIPAGYPYPTVAGGHPQMMSPGGPQPPQFRQYAQNPQFIPMHGQAMTAPIMVQQGSQGPYMAAPVGSVPVYTTGAPTYGPAQQNGGYPSPGRTAPIMLHSSSYQGQNGQVHGANGQYGQPFYAPQPTPSNSKHFPLCTDQSDLKQWDKCEATLLLSRNTVTVPSSSTSTHLSLTACPAMDMVLQPRKCLYRIATVGDQPRGERV